MKRARRIWLAVTLLLMGIGLWQTGEAAWIHAKAWLAQELIARAWDRTLSGEAQVHPWPNADFWPIARLRLPAQNVDLFVLSDASGRTLAFGPGHLPQSALPDSGGPIVLAGHRDTHFRVLRELRAGDRIELTLRSGSTRTYSVHSVDIVTSEAPVSMADQPSLTLLTCDPSEALMPTTKRMLVSALPIESSAPRSSRTTTAHVSYADHLTRQNSP
jgi:sortase A